MQGAGAVQAKASNGPVRNTHISTQQVRFDENVHQLQHYIEVLEERLNPILRNQPPSDLAGKPTEREYLVPLADYFRSGNDTLTVLNAKLESILDRIEL